MKSKIGVLSIIFSGLCLAVETKYEPLSTPHVIKNRTGCAIKLRIRENKDNGFVYYEGVIPDNSKLTKDLEGIKDAPLLKKNSLLRYTVMNSNTDEVLLKELINAEQKIIEYKIVSSY